MNKIPRLDPRSEDFAVALVVHDRKKPDMIELAREHHDVLGRLRLLATGTTGGLLSEELGLRVDRSASGPEGGDVQIAARIAGGEVDALVFLRDPLTAHPHEPDIQALLKVCDVYGVPVRHQRRGGADPARVSCDPVGGPRARRRAEGQLIGS